MFDNEFDPYEELLTNRNNINELIKAYAHQHELVSQLLFEVTRQNENIRHQQVRIAVLENEVKNLKKTQQII